MLNDFTRFLVNSQCVMGMKTTKINDKRIGLSLNPKHKTRHQHKNTNVKNKKHEMCKIRV